MEALTIAACTLGCKVNFYETEAILNLFEENGFTIKEFEQSADVYIINTCTVTNLGDKKSRQMIRKAKRTNPDAIICAVGCYAQTAADEIAKIEGVNIIAGTKERKKLLQDVLSYKKEAGIVKDIGNIMQERQFEELSVKGSGRTRAYVKIQDGCDQFCTYCIIPYARGPVRSRHMAHIQTQIYALRDAGFKEIVFSGIHVASFGKDTGDALLDLLIWANGVEGIERIRLSSVEPGLITESFVQEIQKLDKLCNHFHLSLQSGANQTLKRMNRRYTKEAFTEAVALLRQYDAGVGLTTDVIVGFPGEQETDFLESYEFVAEIGFEKIHVFPFSPKKGTPASKMDGQISKEVKTARVAKMIELGQKLSFGRHKAMIGKKVNVLFENEVSKDMVYGYTTNYMKVGIPYLPEECVINHIKEVIVVSADEEQLWGKLC